MRNHIKALFFLGLFCLMMLHQAFPHLHHQHEDSLTHSHSEITHSGEHSHHDEGSRNHEESPYGFFGFLMEMHLHSTASSDMVGLKNGTADQPTVVDKDSANKISETQRLSLSDNGHDESPPTYHPPDTYFNPYLSCLDLRGPPSLG